MATASVPLISHTQPESAHTAFLARFRSAMAVMYFWMARSRQRRALGRLDDRLLQDIGVTRAQARRESRKWFWQD